MKSHVAKFFLALLLLVSGPVLHVYVVYRFITETRKFLIAYREEKLKWERVRPRVEFEHPAC